MQYAIAVEIAFELRQSVNVVTWPFSIKVLLTGPRLLHVVSVWERAFDSLNTTMVHHGTESSIVSALDCDWGYGYAKNGPTGRMVGALSCAQPLYCRARRLDPRGVSRNAQVVARRRLPFAYWRLCEAWKEIDGHSALCDKCLSLYVDSCSFHVANAVLIHWLPLAFLSAHEGPCGSPYFGCSEDSVQLDQKATLSTARTGTTTGAEVSRIRIRKIGKRGARALT